MEASLQEELNALKASGRFKVFHSITSPMGPQVQMEGYGKVLVLSSNNYLGLASHVEVIEAGRSALLEYGAGTASVRFICGTFSIHDALEAALAKLHRTEAALTYSSCWAANTGLIPAIAGAEDALISDELNHASLIDGCRLSKAKRAVYRHSDMQDLEHKLKEAKGARRLFIVTDGVFSMEGDIADLKNILSLAGKYNATVILDDSHGVGALGALGRGTPEYFGIEGKVPVITGTLGKALGGAAGGYIAGSRTLIEYLKQVSRPHIFSNALPATVAASAAKALEILEREPQRMQKLRDNARKIRDGLKSSGYLQEESESAIIPLIVGETALARRISEELLGEGVFVTGFGYPVVPEGKARLRIQASAAFTEPQIDFALDKLRKVLGTYKEKL